MENEAARRRINLIAGHFAPTDDVPATPVLAMKCSGTLNPAVQRCDNRMHFARQGSDSQGFFMKQRSSTQPDISLTFSTSGNDGSYTASEAPIFSRPARTGSSFPNVSVGQQLAGHSEFDASDPPKFARPNSKTERRQFYPKYNTQVPESNGIEWSPRMDVAESGCLYVVSVELPGIGINDIRVEIKDQSLTVAGKRSSPWWKVTRFSNDFISKYYKREILQGQYQVVWPLPVDVNKDSVSAEFKDGILQIILPKLGC